MDSIFSFSQIFSGQSQTQNLPDHADPGQMYTSVPEAPVYDDIPEMDFFLKDSGDATYKKHAADQGQPHKRGGPVARKRSLVGNNKKPEGQTNLQERDDEDTIYLGSQYPVVHKVRASQAERLKQNMDIEVFVNPGVAELTNNGRTPITSDKRNRRKFEHSQKATTDGRSHFNTASVQHLAVDRRVGETLTTPAAIVLPTKNRSGFKLRSVTEISEMYRKLFSFPYFNIVQSKVFDDVMYTDKPLVLCSPTGSGKTAVFEMAIVRLLQQSQAAQSGSGHTMKVVYMAPIKALCSEKFADWKGKFECYGLRVVELTGDTDTEDFYELQEVNIILTTPEKWDSMTRKWRDNRAVMEAICLFLIDEIHVLNDTTRGATVEAVLSRMKTIQAARGRAKSASTVSNVSSTQSLRFLAVSATITNIEDLAEWLGCNKDSPALFYKFDDSVRPVRLRKVVLGFYFAEGKQSEFQFDLTLSYKMTGIINTYAENKPTLVFCATRKSAIQGAETLARDGKQTYIRHGQHRQLLQNFSFHIKDTKLRDLVAQGIGYHHAGMDLQDRKSIEQIFTDGELPVLVATSTLAMGVNLPAHLVIVKSTMYYHMGVHQEYSDTQVLQMIGRAGRPQFDTSATAVIMTKTQTKMKYENLINGTQLLESSLHKNLIEHLNAEIVLRTITDMSVAVEWLKYTFLYIRVMKNPQHYGMQSGLTRNQIEKKLQEMCMQCLNRLHGLNLIHMDQETLDVKPTENGRTMARYCISYRTAELFHSIGPTESVAELLTIISKCEEYEDILLRTNEKKSLNTLNKDKNRLTIRYPMNGKIKTSDMKVNCLIQAQFGCLLVQDFALQQDSSRIFRAGIRITRCLVELLSQKSQHYKSMLSALQLCKCFKARIWEDSKYVSRQLEGIGPALSTAIVNAGLVTFEKIEQTNPREIELIVNRHPPFGNQVRNSVAKLPKYEIVIEQLSRYNVRTAEIVVTVQLANRESLQDTAATTNHTCTLLIGDEDNNVIYKQRIMDKLLMKESTWCKRLEIKQATKGPEIHVHYISQDWVGLDVDCTYTPNYLGEKRFISSSVTTKMTATVLPPPETPSVTQVGRPCHHTCHNKALCAHECCKTGVATKRRSAKTPQVPSVPGTTRSVSSHLSELKNKAATLTSTPSLAKRQRINHNEPPVVDLSRFAYTTNKPHGPSADHDVIASDCDVIRVDSPYVAAPLQGKQKISWNQPKIRDWSELDMYQKGRERCQTEMPTNYYDADSLPDIDGEVLPYSHLGPGCQAGNIASNAQDMRDEDFAQETDYGYAYVQSQDQNVIPAEWDDKVLGQLNNHTSVGRSSIDTTRPSQYQRVRGIFKHPTEVQVQGQNRVSLPSYLTQRYGNQREDDYDIQEFSDEEEQSDERTNNPRTLPLKRDVACTRTGIPRADNYTTQYQHFNNNLRTEYDDRTTLYTDDVTYGSDEEDVMFVGNKENRDLQKVDVNQDDDSKWDNYCDTQETSVSDCLNWQYPTRVGGEVVMESMGNNVGPNRGQQQKQGGDKAGKPSHCGTDLRDVDQNPHRRELAGKSKLSMSEEGHKYGQVLAWVSDNENQGSEATASQEWEPWGSQEEQLACADPVPARKTDLDPPRWPCEDSDTPMKDSDPGKPAKMKKPRFTSFFSKEQVDAPIEGFYNIFDGIF